MASGAIGSLFVSLGLDTAAFTAGMQQATSGMGQFSARLRSIGTGMTAAITAPLAGLALGAQAAARSLGELDNQARVAGMAAQDFKVLALAADQFGISQEKVADIMKDVGDKIGDFMQTGAGPMKDFFEKIGPQVGVTAEQFKNLNSRDALALYVSSLEKANLSQAEMTFYMEAIASDATALLPVFSDNAKALNEMNAEAKRLGLNLDGDLIAAAKKTEAQFRITKDVLGIQFQQALVQLAPAVSQIMGAVIPLVTKLAGWVTDLAAAFSNLSPQTQAFIAGAVGLAAALGPVLVGIGMVFPAVVAFGGALAALASPIGLIVLGVAALAAGTYYLYQNWDAAVARVPALGTALEYVQGVVTSFVAVAQAGLSVITNLLNGEWGAAWTSWQGLSGAAIGAVNAMLGGLPQAAIDAMVGLAAALRDKMAQLGQDMQVWAGDIIDGFIQGFTKAHVKAYEAVTDLAKGIADRFTGFLDINSPSRVFAGYGDNVVQGLAIGIDRSANLALDAVDGLAKRLSDAGSRAVVGMRDAFATGLAKGDFGAAVNGALSGYMTSASSAAADIFKTAFSGGGLKSIVGSISGAFKGIGGAFAAGGGGFSAALGSAMPLVGLATSLAGLIKGFASKTKIGAGLQLNVAGGDIGGQTTETFSKTSWWGLRKWNVTSAKALSADVAASLQAQLDMVQARVREVYGQAGVQVSDAAVNGFKFGFSAISTMGKTQDQIAAEIAAQFSKYQDGLSQAIAGVSLSAVGTFVDVTAALRLAGQRLVGSFTDTVTAASSLADVFGGVQNLSSAISGFVGAFFTDAQKLEIYSSEVQAGFAKIGAEIPATMADFANLVLAQDLMTEAGRANYRALLDISDEFAAMISLQDTSITGLTQTTSQAVEDAAARVSAAFDALDGRYVTEFDARLARIGQAKGYDVTAVMGAGGAVDRVLLAANEAGNATLAKILDIFQRWDAQGMPDGMKL